MDIEIEQFFKSGRFGPIEIGMQKEKIISLLGAPSSDCDLRESGCILLYGWYEFFIDHYNQLHYIQNDSYNACDMSSYLFKNTTFKVVPWLLDGTQNQDIEIVIHLLKEKAIKYKLIQCHGRSALRLDSGVVLDFTEEVNAFGKKELIGFWFPQNRI